MIKKYSLHALQKAINYALSLDDAMPAKMADLEGKLVEIVVSPLNVNFFIAFSTGQLLLLDSSPKLPDTIIRSSPLGLIRLSLLPISKTRSLFNDSVHITGDIVLGQDIKALFDKLDIDWEGHLAHFTGDVIAYQLGSLVRQGLTYQRTIKESLQRNVTDYLQEELRVFPSQEEVKDFFNDVHELSLDVERMHAQLDHVTGSHENH